MSDDRKSRAVELADEIEVNAACKYENTLGQIDAMLVSDALRFYAEHGNTSPGGGNGEPSLPVYVREAREQFGASVQASIVAAGGHRVERVTIDTGERLPFGLKAPKKFVIVPDTWFDAALRAIDAAGFAIVPKGAVVTDEMVERAAIALNRVWCPTCEPFSGTATGHQEYCRKSARTALEAALA